MPEQNRQYIFASRPVGYPKESDFNLVSSPMPTPGDGEVLIRTCYLSVDPYMRGRMRKSKSYAASLEIGDVVLGGTVGQVVNSKHPDFHEGDIVKSYLGWQEYGVAAGNSIQKVDPSLAPISTALGVLGMPGLTAYFGLLETGQLEDGEHVLVSGAAGAVGSTVGQIAKIKGCRVVGVAGTDEKINHVVNDLGFDDAFNYNSVTDYDAKLQALCSDGVDVYFDNTGGPVTDAVFLNINLRGRMVICGQISQYNLQEPDLGPRLLWQLITKRARVEGMLVSDFAERHEDGLRQMGEWVRAGKLKYKETITEGLENAASAFISMLKGGNIGKQLVKVSEPE
ncbi:MAG: NADP-dependent oxidoreductase [Candidatus Poribacteria bacterium]|nr:NADP-dependent oxidoreductase [Candidatus Poribacteria bacterium]MDE0504360.1 NADP-dependent oxidoreductase [Candidatus Poribacteria bacterium]